ncbi:MAG: cobalt ECF transporter T component CbiQ [Chromatiaceae bacterium]|jgi:cobalt/nickel transport system permease protein|nr:cobalt ECF transporter T component CbiQ [Chromatiaceae bacterium]
MNGLLVLAGEGRDGWLRGRDLRLRLLAAFAFALVTVSLGRPLALGAALATALVLALAGGLSRSGLARRLLPVEVFLALVVLTLPFSTPGEPWLRLGPLVASWEGLLRGLEIALKANAVVLAVLGLLGGSEPIALGQAMARLGVPDKLVALYVFTLRYLAVLQAELGRLRQSMRARAFVARSDWHTWRSLGWLAGMLLVRSLERSRRVLGAMKCRGFDGRVRHLREHSAWTPADTGVTVLLAAGLAALLALEHLA